MVKHSAADKNNGKSDIVCTYTGKLTQERNEPVYALKLFTEAAKIDSRISLVFTTKGNCQEKLNDFSEKNPGVICSKSFVSYDELCEIRKKQLHI